VPEVARAHAGRDYQIVVVDRADAYARGRRLDRAGCNVDAGDLRQEHAEVSLLHLELPDGRGDFRRREDRRRHLVEQRLKYMMIAAVDQNDVDVGVTQGTRCGDSGKAGTDDDDALSLSVGIVDDRCCFARPGLSQHRTHWFTSFVLFVIYGFSKCRE
jgi:hypothetical protein